MHWPEISVIPCFAKIHLNGIPTVGNLTEINWTFKTRKFPGNLIKILMEMLNGNGTGNKRPELLLTEISTKIMLLPKLTV